MIDDPIYVECINCGHGHRWIPADVQRELKELVSALAEAKDEIRRLRFFNEYFFNCLGPADGEIYDMAETAWEEEND